MGGLNIFNQSLKRKEVIEHTYLYFHIHILLFPWIFNSLGFPQRNIFLLHISTRQDAQNLIFSFINQVNIESITQLTIELLDLLWGYLLINLL